MFTALAGRLKLRLRRYPVADGLRD